MINYLISDISAISAMENSSELEAFEAMMRGEDENNWDEDLMKWASIDTAEDNAYTVRAEEIT